MHYVLFMRKSTISAPPRGLKIFPPLLVFLVLTYDRSLGMNTRVRLYFVEIALFAAIEPPLTNCLSFISFISSQAAPTTTAA